MSKFAMLVWQHSCSFVDLRTIAAVRRTSRANRNLTVPEFRAQEWIRLEHLFTLRQTLRGLQHLRLVSCTNTEALASSSLTTLELKLAADTPTITWPTTLRRLALHGSLTAVEVLPNGLQHLELRGTGFSGDLPDATSVRLSGRVWSSEPENATWNVQNLVWNSDHRPATLICRVLTNCANTLKHLDLPATPPFQWPVLPRLLSLRTDWPVVLLTGASFQVLFPRLRKLFSLYPMRHDFSQADAQRLMRGLSLLLSEVTFAREHAKPLRVTYNKIFGFFG